MLWKLICRCQMKSGTGLGCRFYTWTECNDKSHLFRNTFRLVCGLLDEDNKNYKGSTKHNDYSCQFRVFESCDGAVPGRFPSAKVSFAEPIDEERNRILASELFGRTLLSLHHQTVQGNGSTEAMECLHDYRKNKLHLNALLKLENDDKMTEADVSSILLAHLFRPLTPKKNDCFLSKKEGGAHNPTCPCGCGYVCDRHRCELGNKRVWHGYPDVIVGNSSVIIREDNLPECDLEDSDENGQYAQGNLCYRDEYSSGESHGVEDGSLGQAVATTITNSFFMTSIFDFQNTLVPCILANRSGLKVFFYDCRNDILLETRKHLPLLTYAIPRLQLTVNMHTVTFLWMCLNYIHFGPYLPEKRHVSNAVHRSRFFEVIDGKFLDIYRSGLTAGMSLSNNYKPSKVNISDNYFWDEGQTMSWHDMYKVWDGSVEPFQSVKY